MASVHRRPRSPFWFCAFRSGGKLVLRSSKQTDKSKALGMAIELERCDKLARRGELLESQARSIVDSILERAGCGERLRSVTVTEHFKSWLASKDARKATSTAARYTGVVGRFLTHLAARASKPISSIRAQDVDDYIDGRVRDGVASRTLRLEFKTVKGALDDARRKGLILTNVAEAVELPRSTAGNERTQFTAAEVGILVRAADDLEMRTLIMAGYYLGVRIGDASRLRWEGVDFVAGTITFSVTKTGKPLTVPMHHDLRTHLEKLAGTDTPSEFITPTLATQKTGSHLGLSQRFAALMKVAGVGSDEVVGNGGRRFCGKSFHSLRHGFTSALANAGVAPELRMKLTGHGSEAVHRGYTHHEMEVLRSAVEKLPGLTAKKGVA